MVEKIDSIRRRVRSLTKRKGLYFALIRGYCDNQARPIPKRESKRLRALDAGIVADMASLGRELKTACNSGEISREEFWRYFSEVGFRGLGKYLNARNLIIFGQMPC